MPLLPLQKNSPTGGSVQRPTSIFAAVDDAALVEAVLRGQISAKAELFDRHVHHVRRVLARILGSDFELSDLIHEVFLRALGHIDSLEDPGLLKSWLTGIAVHTARECLRRRVRGRWLRFFRQEELPEVEGPPSSDDAREALRATYALLDRLGVEERIVFTLRFIDGLELTGVAGACGVSLNTVKRRIARAERRFVALAKTQPALRSWLDAGTRWRRT
jgi:RNA polymerase sigma-70 factor (ECF subfamily)